MKQIIATAALLVLVAGGYFAWKLYGQGPSEVPIHIAAFSCEQGKTIGTVFYNSKVELTLSDGRKFTLPQAVAASGARYANADESFVFWNKGNTAFITEGKGGTPTTTYSNCVTGGEDSSTPQNDMTSYSYPPLGFSIKYPKGYSLDESYMYQGLGEEGIPGVKVSVPASITEGTNLSSDTGVSVEYMPNAQSCAGGLFLYDNPASSVQSDGGISYSVATTSGAGAGNIYEEYVYALAGQNPCIAIRYFIHYTQIGNYPAGTKKEFDRAALLAQFNQIRHSLTLKNQAE